MHSILRKLAGSDRRSIGKSNQVVAAVLANSNLFGIVFNGMLDDNPVLRMRCADAVEKITITHPEYLLPYKKQLLGQIAKIPQPEVRWHLAQLFSRIKWTARERRNVLKIVSNYLNDESKIVKTFSMQALADIAEQDEALRSPIRRQLEKLTRSGSPAMKARGKKLLAKLNNH
jgi:hypothetical protein